jgi:hypothetical protein
MVVFARCVVVPQRRNAIVAGSSDMRWPWALAADLVGGTL